jgi:putative two-component system response regulator
MVQGRHVLVVDDDEWICELVRTTLELEGIEVRDARHVIEAERLIQEHVPDAILLDIGLPGIDGLFYCERLRESPRTRSVPIIVISGTAQSEERAAAAGATAFVRKPLDPLELLTLLERTMGVAPLGLLAGESASAHAAELERLIEIGHRQHELLNQAHRETLVVLGRALDSRDFGFSDHSQRVSAYAMRLTLEVAPSLSDDPSLEWGFLLHDVGKIGVPDRILSKPGKLDREERAELERHPVIGEELLSPLPLLRGEGLRVVRSHHERWDGKGYPDRLEAHAIPIGARIFAAVDALDAMTDTRPYRKPVSWAAAMAELGAQAGSHFDPDIVDGVVACEPDLQALFDARTQTPEPTPAAAARVETGGRRSRARSGVEGLRRSGPAGAVSH